MSRVARNVYSRPDTHSVTSILARARSSGILCRVYLYRAHYSQTRGRGGFFRPEQSQLERAGAERAGAQADIIGHLEAALLVTVLAAIVVSCFVRES